MPRMSNKLCSVQGCYIVVPAGTYYCSKHKPEPFQRNNRYVRDKFYDSTAWKKCSRSYLIEHPLCISCKEKGRTTPAVHTDHIIPIGKGGSKLDRSNLQPLCLKCHASKTGKEKKC